MPSTRKDSIATSRRTPRASDLYSICELQSRAIQGHLSIARVSAETVMYVLPTVAGSLCRDPGGVRSGFAAASTGCSSGSAGRARTRNTRKSS